VISIFKVFPNGNKESKNVVSESNDSYPPQTTAVHGITDEEGSK
jgi:DNA polymerase-3 subunit epsilon